MARGNSWGRLSAPKQTISPIHWAHEAPELIKSQTSLLAYGNGRSYGDCCLNDGELLIDARGMDHCVHFDRAKGTFRAEAGLTLGEMLEIIEPAGWFLPVTPGTQYVTLGGAVANDVHGKNHHGSGTFGMHVTALRLQRSDGQQYECTWQQNPELFKATIAGLGLTGLILEVEIRLKPIETSYLRVESQRFNRLEDFFHLSDASAHSHEYSVAWVDCLAQGQKAGRGVFMRANHATREESPGKRQRSKPKLSVPLDLPYSLVRPPLVRLFNPMYFHRSPVEFQPQVTHYQPFFYPLDGIEHWNRLYGPKGFYQFQCVVPPKNSHDAIKALLHQVSNSRQASFLAVLKVFGDAQSPGMLSFPRPGTTLAMDFPNRGKMTIRLLERLHQIVMDAQGAIYPAKDAAMPADLFQQGYPALQAFNQLRDPAFSSSLWRRLNGSNQ